MSIIIVFIEAAETVAYKKENTLRNTGPRDDHSDDENNWPLKATEEPSPPRDPLPPLRLAQLGSAHCVSGSHASHEVLPAC